MSKKVMLGEWHDQALRVSNLVNGGLIAIGIVILQDFIALDHFDIPAFVSLLAFAFAIPLLAGHSLFRLLLSQVNYYVEMIWFRILFDYTRFIGLFCGWVGVVSAFWYASWIAGLIFSVTSVAFLLIWLKYQSATDDILKKEKKDNTTRTDRPAKKAE